jgi:hypothetical protein
VSKLFPLKESEEESEEEQVPEPKVELSKDKTEDAIEDKQPVVEIAKAGAAEEVVAKENNEKDNLPPTAPTSKLAI